MESVRRESGNMDSLVVVTYYAGRFVLWEHAATVLSGDNS